MIGRAPLLLIAAAVGLLGATGCSAIPAGAPPAAVAGAPRAPLALRAAVALPRLALAADEEPKEYRAGEVLDAHDVGGAVAAWLEASALFARARASDADEPEALEQETWREGEDLVIELELRELRTVFDGHNAWWIPNIINWLWWMVPAWFVATEEYSLGFEAELVARSAATQAVLHRARLPVRVEGTFDEFDRGWQFFGFIAPRNDGDNWRQIGRALAPAAASALGRAVAEELCRALPAALAAEAARERLVKTLALVVGISHYEDAHALPPLPFAARDADAVRRALQEGLGLSALHVTSLSGSRATRAALEETLADWRERLREGDRVIVYFAGYGTRGEGGRPQLLLYEADGAGRGALWLDELARGLGGLPARSLVVLDTSFDGRGRSVPGAPIEDPAGDLAAFEAAGVAAMLATSADAPLRAPEAVGASLFGHHFAAGLGGKADRDLDGRLSVAELFGEVADRTVADSSYLGPAQWPRAAALEGGLTFELSGRETK